MLHRNREWVHQMCLLEHEVPMAISQCHRSVLGGHFALAITWKRCEDRFWWPGMKKNLEDVVRRCQNCQMHGPRRSPLRCMPLVAHQPWEVIQMDWILGLPETADRNKAIVVAVD